jgi:hypothetical protein
MGLIVECAVRLKMYKGKNGIKLQEGNKENCFYLG